MSALESILRQHHVLVRSDSRFQSEIRLLQALWRERQGLPAGLHRGLPLGSRLEMPRAKETLENYLTDNVRGVVRREVLDQGNSGDKLYKAPRIFNDLLSSQPMCFNLFGELKCDLEMASRVFQRLHDRVDAVTDVNFEHSPGRGEARFTDDKSAFDVFVDYVSKDEKKGFIGIEVKYHENLKDDPARLRQRYEEVADAMGVFRSDCRDALRAQPLQQIWRDHLLAGSMLLADCGYDEGFFAFLSPRGNVPCANAVAFYRECLADSASFKAWSLEEVVGHLRDVDAGPWVDRFHDRYLDFSKVEQTGL